MNFKVKTFSVDIKHISKWFPTFTQKTNKNREKIYFVIKKIMKSMNHEMFYAYMLNACAYYKVIERISKGHTWMYIKIFN